jgi:hypothetical protein
MNKKVTRIAGGLIGATSVVALAWSLLSSPQLAHADEPAENLLKNSSLDGDPFSDTSWTKGNAIDGVEYGHDHRKGEGDKPNVSLKIKKTANRYFPIAAWEQTIDNTPGMPAITVSAKVKSIKVTKAVIDAIFLDEHGDPMEHKWVSYIGSKKGNKPLDHDWKEYSGTVAIPSGCSKITISLQEYGPGTVLFDDITAAFEEDASKITDALSFADPNDNETQRASASLVPANPAASNDDPNSLPAQIADPAAMSNGLAASTSSTNDIAIFNQQGNSAGRSQSAPLVGSQKYETANSSTNSSPFSPSTTPPATSTSNPAISVQPGFGPVPVYSMPNTMSSQQNFINQAQPYVPYPGVANAPFSSPEPDAILPDAIFPLQIASPKDSMVNGLMVRSMDVIKKYRTTDGQQFDNHATARSHAATLKFVAQYRKDTDAEAKAKTREDLTAAVQTEYDHLRADRLKEIDELTKKLEDVKASLAKRDLVKDKIIEKRVEQLLGVDQLYQWDTGSTRNPQERGQYQPSPYAPVTQPPTYPAIQSR